MRAVLALAGLALFLWLFVSALMAEQILRAAALLLVAVALMGSRYVRSRQQP
jgi:hypothetical protein